MDPTETSEPTQTPDSPSQATPALAPQGATPAAPPTPDSDLLAKYAALGSPEQLASTLKEVESLRAGVDDAKVDKLATQRAEKQLEQLRKPLDGKIKSLETTLGLKDKALQTATRQLHDVVARNLWQRQVAASEDFKGLDPLAVSDLYGKAYERDLVKLQVPDDGDIHQARLVVWDPAADAPMGDGKMSAADLVTRFRDTGPNPTEDSDRPFAGLHYFFTSNQSGPGLDAGTRRSRTTVSERLGNAGSVGAIGQALAG